MSAAIGQKLSLIAGILLILLGVGYLGWLGVSWYSIYRMAHALSAWGFRAEPPTLEGWAYLLAGVVVIAAGVFLVIRARRRQPA